MAAKKKPLKKTAAKKAAKKKAAPKKKAAAPKKPAAAKKKAAPKKKATPKKKAAPKKKSVRAKAPKQAIAPPVESIDEDESPGWTAIDEACSKIHGAAPLFHYTPRLPFGGGGDDPLEAINVFLCKRGEPHWHFVTYGFSELHEKSADDAETSGFGFELTFRLRRGEETEPPPWACTVLRNLARYVFRTGNAFGVGHHVPLNGALESQLHVVAFALDPELGAIDTPFGVVEFLQLVGITRDEAKAIKRWSSAGVLELLAKRDPLMITALERPSLLSDPATRSIVEERTRAEGSTSAATYTDQLAFTLLDDGVSVQVGAIAVEDLLALVEGRILFGREFRMIGRGNEITFRPSDVARFDLEPHELDLDVTPELARELLGKVRPTRGLHRFDGFPSLTLEVVPTEIRDQDGNVTEIIG